MADETIVFSPQIKRFLCFGDVKYPLIRTYENIGRKNKSHIHLKNREISANHAVIKISNNNVFIRDLNSKNGTKIDETPLSPYHYYQIKNNNIIKFGNCLESKFIEVEADTNKVSASSTSNSKGQKLNENSNEKNKIIRLSGYYLRSKDKNKI